MKAIIHIGTEKTGSTSIHEFLRINSDLLLNSGIYFPNTPGSDHRLLPTYGMGHQHFNNFHKSHNIHTKLQREDFDSCFRQDFIDEIKSLPKSVHSVVISSEHFHSSCIYKNEVEKIKALVSQLFSEILIICYIRPQIDVATSLYSTALRTGASDSIESFITRHSDKAKHFYKYDIFLDLWKEVFGKESISVHIFDTNLFSKNNVILDFLRKIGLNIENENNDWKFPERLNKSISIYGQYFLRLTNQAIPRFIPDQGVNPLSIKLVRLVEATCIGKGDTPSIEFARTFQSKFIQSNKKVLEEWFPEQNDLFHIDYNKYLGKTYRPSECEDVLLISLLELLGKNKVIELDKRILATLAEPDANKKSV